MNPTSTAFTALAVTHLLLLVANVVDPVRGQTEEPPKNKNKDGVSDGLVVSMLTDRLI